MLDGPRSELGIALYLMTLEEFASCIIAIKILAKACPGNASSSITPTAVPM